MKTCKKMLLPETTFGYFYILKNYFYILETEEIYIEKSYVD